MDPSDRDEPTTESAGVPDAPPADWLAEVGARAGLAPEAIDALAGWLAAQAEVERFAQLERAGHSVEERIPLARVFVDLQVGHAPVGEVGRRERETQPFLAFLNMPRELRREPRDLEREERARGKGFASTYTDRVEGYALIGGPGQGKSTLGQLLCQLQRAWLLRPRIDRLDKQPERDAVEAFTDDRAVASLGRPAELRFPIRIALADAASWLARRGDKVEAARGG